MERSEKGRSRQYSLDRMTEMLLMGSNPRPMGRDQKVHGVARNSNFSNAAISNNWTSPTIWNFGLRFDACFIAYLTYYTYFISEMSPYKKKLFSLFLATGGLWSFLRRNELKLQYGHLSFTSLITAAQKLGIFSIKLGVSTCLFFGVSPWQF